MKNGLADKHWPRRLFEAGFFVVLISTAWTLDTFTKLTERGFQGGSTDTFILFTHQATSAFVVMLLIPCIAGWLGLFPLNREHIWRASPGHILGHALSALAHYFLIIGLRFLIYALFSREFIFSPYVVQNVIIEYLEAARNYVVVGTAEKEFLVRETLGNLEETLAPEAIVRQTPAGTKYA